MAKFKISLITSINGNKDISNIFDQSTFIPTVISNYNSQVQYTNHELARANSKSSFSYTYEEKLSIHQNAQKELTFKMDRKLLLHDEWMDNPYVSAIHVGSLIELQDKYDNTYLFIVNKINYSFKEHNIVYEYTCQDAFSYQYTRQQSGFTITNDYSSEDFIGPKTIDWWVIQKIAPECYIQYQYVPLSLGLYAEKTNNSYKVNTFTKETREKWRDEDGIERIILKEPYTDEELFTPITFSCSNSNANAALIALGENLDLMIHTYEHINEKQQYYKYFWYEPKQNQDISGITYSPKKNIKDFGLNFQGDSLTTVLNVNSHELGDDIVTLFPQIPDFFTTLFSSEQWKKTKFYPGYFSDIIDGQYFTYTVDRYDDDNLKIDGNIEIKQIDGNNYICIPFNLSFNNLYSYFSDNWNDEQLTILNFLIDNEVYTFEGKNTTSFLIITINNNNTKEYIIVKENEKIPLDILTNRNYTISFGIKTNHEIPNNISLASGSIYFKWYRLFSEEEKEFAYIADNCPWLENRLIDFSYFYQQGIISTNEYAKLMDILINNLRIINGRLMYLTNNYYQAIKRKVEYLSKLQQEADILGAQFEADIVNPITLGTQIGDIQTFKQKYNEVFTIENYNSIPIVDYNDLISEYCEKYMDSEQSFLKNCYEFRRYFNEPFKSGSNEVDGLYKYTLSSINDLTNSHFISFSTPSFTWIRNENDKDTSIFEYSNNKYKLATLVNDSNKTNYYIPQIQAGQFILVEPQKDESNKIIIDKSIYDYSENNEYYISEADYKTYFNSFLEQNEDWLKDRKNYSQNDITYYQLNTDELRRLVIAANYDDYYIRDTNTYTKFSDVRIDQNEFKRLFNFESLPDIMTYIDPYYQIGDDNDTNQNNFMWEYYKSFFPVDEIYYYGPNVRIYSKEDSNNVTTYYLETLDKFNKLNKESADKKFQPVTFANDGAMLSDWGSCGTDKANTKKDSIQNNWKYLAYTYTGDNNVYWWTLLFWPVAHVNGIIDTVGYNGGNVGFLGRYTLQNTREAQRSIEDKVYNESNRRYDSALANYVKNSADGDIISNYKFLVEKLIEAKQKSPSQTVIDISDNVKLDISNFNLNNLDTNIKNYYWNFYKYIVATYSFRNKTNLNNDNRRLELNNLFVKNSYFEILDINAKINKQEEYVIIPITQTYGNVSDEPNLNISNKTSFKYFKDKFTVGRRYSALKYYNLIHLSQTLDTKNVLLWENNKEDVVTLEQVINMINSNGKIAIEYNSENNLFTFADNNNSTMTAYIAKLYNYNKINFSLTDLFPIDHIDNGKTYPLDKHNFNFMGESTYDHIIWSSVYSRANDVLEDPLKRDAALNFRGSTILNELNLYMVSRVDSLMMPIDKNQTDLDNQFIYKKVDDNKYERAYTFNQLYSAKDSDTTYCTTKAYHRYYIMEGSSEEYSLLNNSTTTFSPTLYLCTIKQTTNSETGEKEVSFSSEKYDQPYEIAAPNLSQGSSDTVQLDLVDSNGIHYTSTVNITKELVENLSNITNGMLWYRFHDRLDILTLFHEAANIATQLQTYWDQAYLASKYCKYFLPKNWIRSSEQTPNNFFNQIVIPQYKQDENNNATLINVIISDKYVPQVEIYTSDTNSALKYKHYLPRYKWTYGKTNNGSMNDFNINQRILNEQANENYIRANTVELITNNDGILDILNTLGTTLDEWTVLENGYTVYYHSIGGGTLWSTLAQDYLTTSEYSKMTGIYGIIFYKLKNLYKDDPTTEYTKAKEEKERIWNNIYLNYPYLMLEENYSYNLATSSSELYKMAQLIFKGKKEPEKGYSLSVIDYYSLMSYHGEELKPGYGIQLNANEYYDENDDIYRALSQYLFITDVSYTLRKDDDLNITVNNIKYQEKLLQSLVKLIR